MHARHGRGGGALRARADDGRRARPGRRQPGRVVPRARRRDPRGRVHAPDGQEARGRRGGGGGPMTVEVRRSIRRLGAGHSEMSALIGFAERQLYVYKRYWVWEIVWLFYSIVSVLSIGFLASGLDTMGAGSGGFDLHRAQLYLLIGALLWGYLSLVFMEAAYAIAWERWEGTIEYTFMAPVRRVTHLMGICLFAIGYGLARTFIVLVVAIAIFDIHFAHANIGRALFVLVAVILALNR